MDVTKILSSRLKDGMRNVTTYGYGDWWAWITVVRTEDQHGQRIWALTVGFLGWSFVLSIGHQDYRGG